MALSNWDTLAIDETGTPTNGTFTSPLGVEVSFYKNWLYVEDKKAWEAGGYYIQPTVMKVASGDVTYKDVNILAKRGPQHGVYALITSGRTYEKNLKVMAGCGVSGYQYPQTSCGHDANEYGSVSFPKLKNGEYVYHTYCTQCEKEICDAVWVGVTKEATEFLQKLLLSEVSEYLEEKEKSEHIHTKLAAAVASATRFNQGDAYFADKLGFETPRTTPENSDEPILTKLL